MKHKFWKWVTNEAPDSFGSNRTLYLDGQISDETWWGDEVTPKAFKEELNAGSGDITLWINSPGGDCFTAAQIYNMLMDYPGSPSRLTDWPLRRPLSSPWPGPRSVCRQWPC